MTDKEKFLTPKDICKHLNLGKDKAYQLCALEGFPAIKLGSTYRIDPVKYTAWLQQHLGEHIVL